MVIFIIELTYCLFIHPKIATYDWILWLGIEPYLRIDLHE